MTVSDKYEFWLSSPTFGVRQVWPVNETIEWEFEKDNAFGYFRKYLATNLVLVDDYPAGRYAFDLIYTMERNKQTCQQIGLIVKKKCVGEVFVQYWNGFFTVADCQFDVDRCNVTIRAKPDDPMACIVKNWELIENAVQLTEPVQDPDVFCGEEQHLTCPEEIVAGGIWEWLDVTDPNDYPWTDCEPFEGWQRLSIRGEFVSVASQTWRIRCTYVRDFAAGVTPPATCSHWTPVTGGFVRPVLLLTGDIIQNDGGGLEYDYTIPTPDVDETSTARSLNTLLVTLVGKYCTTPLISNFFDINADGTQPTNSHYDKAAADCAEILYFSTWSLANATTAGVSPATSLLISLHQLIEGLQTMFNLEFFYKAGAFYLEHISYRTARHMLDLTTPESVAVIKGGWTYVYDKTRYPSKETFRWGMETGLRLEFDGRPIEYDGQPCIGEDAIPLERKAERLVTNYEWIYGNQSIIDQGTNADAVESLNFLVLVCTVDGVIQAEEGEFDLLFTGGVDPLYLNMMFSFANLHRDYWTHGRPIEFGRMNGYPAQFHDIQKVRVLAPIELPMCCEDFDQIFEASDLVKTQLGWCELDGASYSEPSEKLTLKPRG